MDRQPAVFFDRDNTLIEDPGYIDDPAKVRLFGDAPDALRRLRDAGYCLVVATNQSGVARGLLTEDRLDEIHDRLHELLARQNASLDAVYCCPYLDGPEATVDEYRCPSDMRKPEPGMLLKAAEDFDIDLTESWMIGDSGRDIEAGRRAGCRTILLERTGLNEEHRKSNPDHTVQSLRAATDIILGSGRRPRRPSEDEDGPATHLQAAATAKPAFQPVNAEPTEQQSEEAPTTPAPNTDTEPPMKPDSHETPESVTLLREIRDLLDRTTRKQRQQDFSMTRLLATLLQLLAVAVAIWGVVALIGNQGGAEARLLLALFLQVAAIAVTSSDGRD